MIACFDRGEKISKQMLLSILGSHKAEEALAKVAELKGRIIGVRSFPSEFLTGEEGCEDCLESILFVKPVDSAGIGTPAKYTELMFNHSQIHEERQASGDLKQPEEVVKYLASVPGHETIRSRMEMAKGNLMD
jgi:hypothetical protein